MLRRLSAGSIEVASMKITVGFAEDGSRTIPHAPYLCSTYLFLSVCGSETNDV